MPGPQSLDQGGEKTSFEGSGSVNSKAHLMVSPQTVHIVSWLDEGLPFWEYLSAG